MYFHGHLNEHHFLWRDCTKNLVKILYFFESFTEAMFWADFSVYWSNITGYFTTNVNNFLEMLYFVQKLNVNDYLCLIRYRILQWKSGPLRNRFTSKEKNRNPPDKSLDTQRPRGCCGEEENCPFRESPPPLQPIQRGYYTVRFYFCTRISKLSWPYYFLLLLDWRNFAKSINTIFRRFRKIAKSAY